MLGHIETIECPECGLVQDARVEEDTWPFWTWIHFCECGFIIMESEWQQVSSANNEPEGE